MNFVQFLHSRALWGALALAAVSIFAFGAHAEKLIFHAPHGETRIVDTAEKTIPPAPPSDTFSRNGITFNIYYMDVINNTNYGFAGATTGAPAQARLRETFELVADIINMSGTLNVVVNNSANNPGSSNLASAGTYYFTSPGFNKPLSLLSLENGSPISPGTEEIIINVNFGKTWNLTTNPPAFNEFDFVSVMLHEITHGLGFAALMSATGAGSLFDAPNTYSKFAEFIYGAQTNGRVVTNPGPAYTGTASELANNPSLLSFDGSNTQASYGSRPGIYAPSPHQGGSSYSHWNTGNVNGNPVMEHAIAPGVMKREYEFYEIETLRDIGWINAEALGILVGYSSPTYTVCENGGSILVEVVLSEQPGATTVEVDYGIGAGGDTATAGVDYVNTSGTLSFTGTQTSQTFSITILDNADNDGDRTATLTLSNLQNGSLGANATATLTIEDDETAPGSLYISGPTFVEEGDSPTLTLMTALSGLDLDSPSVALQWEKDTLPLLGENATTLQLTNVTALNDGVYRCFVDDGGCKSPMLSEPYALSVLPLGSVPVGGTLAMGLLAGACALAGAAGIRRRKR